MTDNAKIIPEEPFLQFHRPTNDGKVVGNYHSKIDGFSRLTGEAIYTDDIALPMMAHAKILRSPYPHAKILSIDTSEAESLEGVYGIVTGKEMPIPYCVIPWTPDENALCIDKVRYVGDAVAAVAARDEETAANAIKKIKAHYQPLKPLLDLEQALSETKVLIHENNKSKNNILKNVQLEFGNIDEQLATSDLIIEGDYFFEGTTHAAIEPHCAIGQYDTSSGLLTVWSATQVPHYLHRELSKVLEIPAHQIRVIQPAVGGAFGGKSEPFDLEFCAAKLAMKIKRPVKILYTREEVFYSHRGRHPMKMKYKTGFTKTGKITGVDAKILIDGGAYSSFGLVTTYYSGQLNCAPYTFQAYRFDSTRVYTNKPCCGPKRGHGSVQPRFAIEVQLDKAAVALNIDPIELRRLNFIGDNTRTINELRITSNGFLQCLDMVEKASGWKHRRGKLGFGRGLGIAGSTYISGTNYPIYPNAMPQSAVQITLDRSGRARIFSGVSEIGQGCNTVLGVIAAQELGLSFDDIRIIAADTDLTPVDLGAYSSRITFMAGNACLHAALKLQQKVTQAISKRWQCLPSEITLIQRQAIRQSQPDQKISIVQAFQWAEEDYGTLSETGHYNTPGKAVHGDYRGGTIGASPAYSFTAHVAKVIVDIETGELKVEKIWAAHDCGKALSPVLVEGQIEGSVYMGAAEALMEEHTINDNTGLHNAPSLLDYRIPTSLDAVDIQSMIVESNDPEGPYGAKEAGEGPLHPSIPAIANAIYDAIGVRIDTLPFTPQKILTALKAKNV